MNPTVDFLQMEMLESTTICFDSVQYKSERSPTPCSDSQFWIANLILRFRAVLVSVESDSVQC